MSSRLISGIAGFGHMLFGYEAEVVFVAIFFLWNWMGLFAAPSPVRGLIPAFRRAVAIRNREGDCQ